jgi:hypothetical protein
MLGSITLTAVAVGCGGQAEQAKYADEPMAQPQQPYPAQPPAAQPPAQQGYGPQAYPQPGAAPAPPPPPPGVGTTKERDITTLSAALDALEEDEVLLGQLLGNDALELSRQGACLRVCDALASMRRSADAICELAGDDDERCGKAQGRLQSNQERVRKASCSCGS